ncbi:signal peptidase II [Microvirga thermotolerans]|uniref:Lipoprotein signal peptidase n=1 Tax=Microvirga thermotolerans TaxID=2651334 RepID=A0A5P9JXP3_9HYPH|nr:signal peptidase II [Microvirga thermotolerans]QFU14734.1 signal peptidase II [Microvirga thermotolerans]
MRARPAVFVLGLIALTAAVDLGTKLLASVHLADAVEPLVPFLSLALAFNRGVSFSMFSAGTEAAVTTLLIVQALATAFVTWFALRAPDLGERTGYGLIAGGALGNLIDRAADGAVTDFLDLHPMAWRLFTFNVADIFISAGVVLLVIDALLKSRGPAARPETAVHERRPG